MASNASVCLPPRSLRTGERLSSGSRRARKALRGEKCHIARCLADFWAEEGRRGDVGMSHRGSRAPGCRRDGGIIVLINQYYFAKNCCDPARGARPERSRSRSLAPSRVPARRHSGGWRREAGRSRATGIPFRSVPAPIWVCAEPGGRLSNALHFMRILTSPPCRSKASACPGKRTAARHRAATDKPVEQATGRAKH